MREAAITIYNTALGKRAGEKVISRDNLLFREGKVNYPSEIAFLPNLLPKVVS